MKNTEFTAEVIENVRALCIKNNWYTMGTNKEYNAMFDMIRDGASPEAIAENIFNASDWAETKSLQNVINQVTAVYDKSRAIFDDNTEATEDPAPAVIDEIQRAIESENAKSAWNRGVKAYALELVDELKEAIEHGYFDADDIAAPKLLQKQLLNGASDWSQYSWGGCSLIYDEDIAKRLCTPSELKKTRNGERKPNASEEWLDTQARALYQAEHMIMRVAKSVVCNCDAL